MEMLIEIHEKNQQQSIAQQTNKQTNERETKWKG